MLPVRVSHRHKVVAVPYRDDVYNMFPAAKALVINGHKFLAVRHQPAETYLLRKLGFDAPAPILEHYDFCGGKPFDAQVKTCAMLTMNERAYVLNGMGTGKTKSALWAWHYLYSNGLCGKAVVVAPLSTLQFTWAREIFQTLPGINAVVLHGSKQKRLDKLNEFLRNEQRIAVYKLPERLVLFDVLPRNPVGKVLKRVLREQVGAASERLHST